MGKMGKRRKTPVHTHTTMSEMGSATVRNNLRVRAREGNIPAKKKKLKT